MTIVDHTYCADVGMTHKARVRIARLRTHELAFEFLGAALRRQLAQTWRVTCTNCGDTARFQTHAQAIAWATTERTTP